MFAFVLVFLILACIALACLNEHVGKYTWMWFWIILGLVNTTNLIVYINNGLR